VAADGRGEAALARTRWLSLPAEDGTVTVADPVDIPADLPVDFRAARQASARAEPVLRAVSGG
jgi:hypothetical protein